MLPWLGKTLVNHIFIVLMKLPITELLRYLVVSDNNAAVGSVTGTLCIQAREKKHQIKQ